MSTALPADRRSILDRVNALPVYAWSFKGLEEAPVNVGPIAQDFNLLFPVGGDDTVITHSNMNGVLVASVQQLSAELERASARIAELERDHDSHRTWLSGASAAAASLSLLAFRRTRKSMRLEGSAAS